MNSESGPTESLPPHAAGDLTPEVAPPSRIRAVFVGPGGIRAGWRFLIYAAFFLAFVRVLRLAIGKVPAFVQIFHQAQGGTLSPAFTFLLEISTIVPAFLAAFLMMRIEKRPFGAYGIPLRGAFGKLFWQGVIWGLAAETLEIALIAALGGYSLGTLALSGAVLIKYAALWAVGFVLVGIAEEFTFRGYPQFTLTTGMGFWPSAIVLSAAFGAVHLGNPGEGWVGALSVVLFGLFACFTLQRTGNLWFAIGFHAASDYAETFIYSVPDSGLLATGHLLNSSFHGPRWLTGGTIGPEGSVMDFVMLLLAFAAFHWLYPGKKAGSPE
jgi:membrane protease YdiL (CAAX protease family)